MFTPEDKQRLMDLRVAKERAIDVASEAWAESILAQRRVREADEEYTRIVAEIEAIYAAAQKRTAGLVKP